MLSQPSRLAAACSCLLLNLFCFRAASGQAAPPTSKKTDTPDLRPYGAVRGGLILTHKGGFDGGIDVSFPRLGVSPNAVGRLDMELIAPFQAPSFLGLPDTKEAFTIGEMFNFHRTYMGVGIGPNFGDKTRFGYKVYVGQRFSSTASVELGAHYLGVGSPEVVLQLRFVLPRNRRK